MAAATLTHEVLLIEAVRRGATKTSAIGTSLEQLRREQGPDWLRAHLERVWGSLVAERRIVRRCNRWVAR